MATLALAASSLIAQQHDYQLHRYDSNDGGILWNLSDNGRWGIIRLGSAEAGGTATPKLFDVERDEAFEVKYNGRIVAVNDVSDDGNVVAGSYNGRPAVYNRATGKLTQFPMRQLWQSGELVSITPDGKWAVGAYTNYRGQFDNSALTGDFYFSPLMVNIETGDTLALPGLPRLDMAHANEHAQVFDAVTPDGRYAIGRMDWYIMQPVSSFTFIYDTQLHTYSVLGFTEHDNQPWTPLYPGMQHIESTVLSPDGHYLAGMAYMAKEQAGSEFFNEYGAPFRYDMQTGEFSLFDETESSNVSVGAVDNQGTLFGNPDSGSPLRNLRILYKDKYWMTFSQICQQYYGFNWQARTGYEYTGTVMAVSGDGRRFISFPDPTCESYLFDFGCPVEQACQGIDLLNTYSVSPEAGSEFSLISNIEINFGRSIQVVGSGSNVHLYKADGTLVYTALSNGGLTMKTGSRSTAVAAFRPRPLEAGTDYVLVIDAGAIALGNDSEFTNKEIRIPYRGRRDGAVGLLKATPSSGSTLRQIDNTSAYVLLDFDTSIKLTDQCLAYVERVEDGTRLTTMTAAAGNTDATRHQLLLTPAASVYLYAGEEYRVVLEAGSVSDYSGSANSYNQRIELLYKGSYVREVASETIMFADDFNNVSASLSTWLMYEGDHRTPSNAMKQWEFDQNNTPWNFSLRDDLSSSDYFAGSHSMYSPAGASDDWMMTPQIAIPSDGKTMLEFDAQSYDPKKHDALCVYVYESRAVLSHLTSSIMREVFSQAVRLDSIQLNAGANQELTADEWTHYSYDLSRWAGKDIYVAFVNRNNAQSVVFVDNVLVQREVLYSLGFSNRDRVVGQESIQVAGQFVVRCDETEGSASLTLRDAEGREVSRVDWPTIPAKDTPVTFAFPQALPLTVGTQVPYSIDVRIGQKADTYQGVILDLAFEPVKRVVLEEMTGSTCVNCPLGIVSIEHCRQAFGDRFIPVAIHTYTGDNLGGSFGSYTSFLGIMGAPMARINRLPEVYSPMARQADEFYYHDVEGEQLWYDVVARELNQLTMADLQLQATLDASTKQLTFSTDLRYALTADNQQLSLFIVILEDGIYSYQQNGFSSMHSATLADWCDGGRYASPMVVPYAHDHVVRGVAGQTYSGTIGLFPADITGGQTYNARVTCPLPSAINNVEKVSAVAMLIDTQTGEVINAIQAPVVVGGEGIADVQTDATDVTVLRTLSGRIINPSATADDLHHLPAGIYLLGNRKVMVK